MRTITAKSPETTSTLFPHYAFWIMCCIIFVYLALTITGNGSEMFADTDPLWHLAAGDWIRQHHAIPLSDPWSFTAGDYRWLNISWGWDTAFSYIYEQLGWHGAFALNAIIIALTMTGIYALCVIRSGNIFTSLITLMCVTSMLVMNLRPLQITNLMTVVWLLLLSGVMRKQCSIYWLAVLPLLMVIWVNSHGGFLVGLILLGAYFLHSLWQQDYDAARWLCAIGIVTIALMVLCNPYHAQIFEAAWRPLTTVANGFITEWQPFTASPHNLLKYFYLVVFIALLAFQRVAKLFPAERFLAYFWLVMGLTSIRHFPIFAIVSAPMVACSLHQLCTQKAPQSLTRIETCSWHCNRRAVALVAVAISVMIALWLPTSSAAHTYRHETIAAQSLKPEIDFLTTHYPRARLLTHFDLAAIVVYETGGNIPVFVDPRTETAFPAQVLKDYLYFQRAAPGWEEMLDRYAINGVILPNKGDNETLDRFRHRNGWKEVFKGPHASIYMRKSAP